MVAFRRGLALVTCSPLLLAAPARAAEPTTCRVINVDFTAGGIPAGKRVAPTSEPPKPGDTDPPVEIQSPEIASQVVAWIEKPSGEYVDTIYITAQTGRFGIGNRPGRFDFNSGANWPYGRRTTVFPVWSHRQPFTFPQVNYRNSDDNNLSHPYDQSSTETHFCRPLMASEAGWDGTSCASMVYTDKGVFGSATSHYPPRSDLTPTGADSPSVAMYKTMNQFDAVSQATPRLGSQTQVSWSVPRDFATGSYVLFVEIALEQDFNATYSAQAAPSPTGIPYDKYGVPYRGQPSVIYQVPFTIGEGDSVAVRETYVGYGDPSGADGKIRPPDATITTDTPNSGALRLLMTSINGDTFRVRVNYHTENDATPPADPGDMVVSDATSRAISLSFAAPGDDGMLGTVTGYDVRYLAGDVAITAANFEAANTALFDGDIAAGGQPQLVSIKNLLPETEYTVAVRAYDNCGNQSAIRTATVTTAARQAGEVDACFIATAAYGSVLANDVEMLRRFRDSMLKRSVLGELAVETYYTFGPPVAGVVGESDLLREAARDLLTPLVSRVRGLRW